MLSANTHNPKGSPEIKAGEIAQMKVGQKIAKAQIGKSITNGNDDVTETHTGMRVIEIPANKLLSPKFIANSWHYSN